MPARPDPRYARQATLREIGAEGQARLCATTVRLDGTGTPRPAEIATLYLERAGVSVAQDGEPIALIAIDGGRPELAEAAAMVSGAWTALEAMKRALGVGTAAGPTSITLAGVGSRDA
ncbi:MAG: hypothetical protein AB7S26_08835 [Sandaracinaceae bacterium]